jgi:F-type H+-transporting ATPase subunit a
MNNADAVSYFAFQLGPLSISHTVLTTWGIMLVFILSALLLKQSPQWQNLLETIIESMFAAISEVIPNSVADRIFPFVATLWLFVLAANLVGLIPEMHSPTSDISATAALAVLVFFASHWFGVTYLGIRKHLRHYLEPSIVLMPFHILSEFTRTLALAIRLFGNIMSLEMAVLLVLFIAGFLVPVPLLVLHVIEAVVQAYIFGMLALIYIAGALEGIDSESNQNAEEKP